MMMNIVRDRAEARWLPSRHRYALMRLIAFLILRNARPKPQPGLILVIDRDQSTLENLTTSIWATLTVMCYMSTAMHGWWKLAAIPVGWIVIQLPLYILGAAMMPLFGRSLEANNHRLNSVFYWSLMTIASAYFVTRSGINRWLAYVFFAVLTLNALAAVILFPLRRKVAELEARCVA
ncbi:MAG: hypothetical protein JOZ54_06160 [Acidobacteria bacterium]|nr:hypothetical protein [Acidobacteriota bacterium]